MARTDGPPPHAGFDADMRVDWIAADELAGEGRGRLGLTFLPGKRGISTRYPGHVYQRRTEDDLVALHEQGVRRLILLVEDAELLRWGDGEIVEMGRRAGVEVVRFPIPDGAAPSPERMEEILAAVDAGRSAGDVAVACMGGVGRTGTVAACALVAAGLAPADAISRVRQVRHPTAVETSEQELLVRAFAARRAQVR